MDKILNAGKNKSFLTKSKRSQAALEFLMTYGWAILVVLVAIGALAYFGVLSPDKFLPSKCQLPAGIACTDFSLSSATGISIVLRNGMGFDVTNIQVRSGKCNGDFTSADNTLSNGEQQAFNSVSAADCTIDSSGGSKFNQGFSVTYTNADSGLTHAVNGTITGRVE